MQKIGKVLWWDRRDQEGIIVDGAGNQYFFNYSLISGEAATQLKDGQFVEFEVSNLVPNVSCADKVRVVANRSKRRAEREFSDQKQLNFGGV